MMWKLEGYYLLVYYLLVYLFTCLPDVCLLFQVIVGSTSLVTPSDLVKRIFCQDNLHPEPS